MHTEAQIVVGVDGSTSAWRALEWAADDAERTGRTLHVAHAGDADAPDQAQADGFGPDLIADVVTTMAENHPRVPVHTVLREADPGELLLALAHNAELLVLGRGRPGLPVLRLGSVVAKVLAHSPCPTVVVADIERNPSNTIVVGASDSPGGGAAMAFAFAEAHRRAAQVAAVRAWSARDYRRAAGAALPISSPEDWTQTERALLDALLRESSAAYPTVTFRGILSSSPVEEALDEEAKGAAMLVLGTRHGAHGHRTRLGPITSWAVHHAHCPVVVVGHAGEASGGAAPSMVHAAQSSSPTTFSAR